MRAQTLVLAASSLAIVALGASVGAREIQGRSLQLRDLPAAVQRTVQDNLKGGAIKNIGKETEDGAEQYEIETVLNGRSRDFNVDIEGHLLVVEEATTIDAIPAAAKAGILKTVADGKLTSVETFTKTGQPTMYEAAYTDRADRRHEVLVNADGTVAKP